MHNDSRSTGSLRIEGGVYRFTGRFQGLSLIEEHPALDADGNGRLGHDELEAGKAWIVQYLRSGWNVAGAVDAPLTSHIAVRDSASEEGPHVRMLPPEKDGFGFIKYQWIEVAWDGEWDAGWARREQGSAQIDWFAGTSPGHREELSHTRIDGWNAYGPVTQHLIAGAPAVPLRVQPTHIQMALADSLALAWSDGAGPALVLAVTWRELSRRAGRRGSAPSPQAEAALEGPEPVIEGCRLGGAWLGLCAGFGLGLGAARSADIGHGLWVQVFWIALIYGVLDCWFGRGGKRGASEHPSRLGLWSGRWSGVWPSSLWGVAFGGLIQSSVSESPLVWWGGELAPLLAFGLLVGVAFGLTAGVRRISKGSPPGADHATPQGSMHA